MQVVLYARISEDTTGEASGVRRQLEECRALAVGRGWDIVDEITDNDLSAAKGGHRPGYAKVLDLVRSGAVSHVVVWQTSRLVRNRRERADAIELFGRQRVGIIAVRGVSFDLSTAYGRGQAGLLGEFDSMESEVKAERVAAAAADRARCGRPNGGLGYGWTKVGAGSSATYAVDPEQAAIVQEITRRLLSGESLLSLTNDLNVRGVPAPAGDRWGKTSVKKIATRPANVALRVHHRGRSTETVYEGAWPPLVDRADWERLTAVLAAPERRQNSVARPGARRHLLTWGIGSCGVCGGFLRVGTKGNSRYGVHRPLYLCAEKGCVGRSQAAVDELVGKVVIARLSRDDALAWLLGDDDEARRQAEVAEDLRRRLDAAADQYADGKITDRQLGRITARLQPRIDDAERARRSATRMLDLDTLRALAGPTAVERWEGMTVTQRRAVLETIGMEVAIDRVTRRGPGFDPQSVRIGWKGASS
ncbi:recombinase family protein [Nocardioides sp.]|uniref:recombinase family protein n=1 Tax=Nocardioides sp. TaxID=35761 RepID=UPI0037847A45